MTHFIILPKMCENLLHFAHYIFNPKKNKHLGIVAIITF